MKTVYYVEFYGRGCGLRLATPRQIMREEGTSNVQLIRPATETDKAWVSAMGGHAPKGKYIKTRDVEGL